MNLVEVHQNNVHGSNSRLKEISQNPKAHSGSGPWTCHIGRIKKIAPWEDDEHNLFCPASHTAILVEHVHVHHLLEEILSNLLTWFSFFLQFELTDILPTGNSSNHPDEWYHQLKQRITMVNWAINNNELPVQKGDPTYDFQERERYGLNLSVIQLLTPSCSFSSFSLFPLVCHSIFLMYLHMIPPPERSVHCNTCVCEIIHATVEAKICERRSKTWSGFCALCKLRQL